LDFICPHSHSGYGYVRDIHRCVLRFSPNLHKGALMPKLAEIKWESTEESSNVDAVYFHEPHNTICVRFKGGGLYSYIGGDQEMYMGLRHAPSVGKYLNHVVKALPYTRWDTETALIEHLNIGVKHQSTCIRCDLDFMTNIEGSVVCDECWADDPV
jgi:hypothetical protein